MKVQHLRTGREMKLGNVLTFMANERVCERGRRAGDIIGIHNHGQLQIGDTLTEGESAAVQGHSVFRAGALPRARPRDPFKAKQLQKGLPQLGEEGAIQVFGPVVGNALLLGAVGQLQFEWSRTVQHEYGCRRAWSPAASRWRARSFDEGPTSRQAHELGGEPWTAGGRAVNDLNMDYAPTVLVEYAPELRAIEANWPKIKSAARARGAGVPEAVGQLRRTFVPKGNFPTAILVFA